MSKRKSKNFRTIDDFDFNETEITNYQEIKEILTTIEYKEDKDSNKTNPEDVLNLDRKTTGKIKRGQIKIDLKLDLHGFKKDEAYIELRNAIGHAYNNRIRVVLVITGKGRQNKGVLKEKLPLWLNHTELKPLVLGFSHASIEHGGEGAYYILIRRKR